jgi:hypothetical protein
MYLPLEKQDSKAKSLLTVSIFNRAQSAYHRNRMNDCRPVTLTLRANIKAEHFNHFALAARVLDRLI